MKNDVMTSLEQVTPEWLTNALRRSGALTAGQVEAFEVDSGERLLSTTGRLRLKYAQGSQGDLPQKLFLKMVNIDQDYSWEQLFYDYRLCAVINVYVATEWCRGQFHQHTMPVWLPLLQKSMTAYDDLDCRKLWKTD